MATPSIVEFLYIAQDDRGFRSRIRLVGYDPDITVGATTIVTFLANVAAVGALIGNMTNAKIVKTGAAFAFDIAQEPTTEAGTYQLVQQAAILEFGDGNTGKERLSIPAPRDNLFLSAGQDNLIVVNPAAASLTALQAGLSGVLLTTTGGSWGSQFFGGQLRQGKPRRRRVLQGA